MLGCHSPSLRLGPVREPANLHLTRAACPSRGTRTGRCLVGAAAPVPYVFQVVYQPTDSRKRTGEGGISL